MKENLFKKKGLLKKSLVLLFVAAICVAYMPLNASAETDWQVSKSKKATELNSNKETTVTLSLPSAEEPIKAKADVVVVMDKSAYADIDGIEQAANNMLESFANNEDVDVKLGIVVFDGWGHDAYSLSKNDVDKSTEEAVKDSLVEVNAENLEDLKSALNYDLDNNWNKYKIGGSNSEQPIRLANSMLAADTSTNNKYVVLLSDLETYVYEGNITMDGVTYGTAPVGKGGYGDGSNKMCHLDVSSGYASWAELYAAYTDGTLQQTSSWSKNQYFRYNTLGLSWSRYWDNIYTGTNKPASITATQYGTYFEGEWNPAVEAGEKNINGNDVSLCKTYDALKASHDAGYNISVFSTSHDGSAGEYSWNALLKKKPMDFLQTIQDEFDGKIYGKTSTNTNIVNQGTSVSDLLSDVEQEVSYLIGSGTVTDQLGENFDLVKKGEKSPFTLTLAGKKLDANKISDNKWGFGTATNGVYQYEVTYDEDTETFIWNINVPVKNSEYLQLSYDLKLTTEESGKYSTNKEAKLDYTDSTGTITGSELFEVPYVTYEAPAKDENTDSTTTTPTTNGGDGTKTGDNSQLPLWMLTGVTAAALATTIGVIKKKTVKEKE